MIETLWVVGIAIGALMLVGLPLVAGFVHFSRSNDPTPEMLWAAAPFAGLAAIVLIAQNLLYLDVRLPVATGLLWLATVLAWVWLLSSGKARSTLTPVPIPLLALSLAVYVLHGLGLFALGAAD